MECSVIIPAFNCEKTIRRAIQSVFDQTYRDFELVIVDDGSSDSTAEIIRSINDPRIKFFQHQNNLGEAETRNTAIKSSSGRYLAFLDSDDEWFPDKLHMQLSTIHSHKNGITANISGFILIDEFTIKRKQIPAQPESWYEHLLMGCGLGPGTNLVVDRNAFYEVGYYDPSLTRFTDWDWLLRYTKSFPLTITPLPLATIYRESIPSAQSVQFSTEIFLKKHQEDFKQFGHYGLRAIGKRYLEVAIYYFVEGDKRNGSNWLKKAISKSVFQRPGMYLRIFDAIMSTSIVPSLIRIQSRFSKDR